jgi:hypothetical protein
MSDYQAVSKALESGADPAMLCATCPWDRTCLSPPGMSRAEVDAKIAEASTMDKKRFEEAQAAGKDPGMPVGLLVTSLVYAGPGPVRRHLPRVRAAAPLQRRQAHRRHAQSIHAGLG